MSAGNYNTYDASQNLNVNIAANGSGTTNQTVDITKVNGVATATGSGTATGALRVELPTNGTGVVGLNAGTNNIGKTTDALLTTTDLTGGAVSISSSGDNIVIAAVSAQSTKVHRLRLYPSAAVTVVVKNGATTLETIPFTGAGAFILDFSTRPYYTTSNNTDFILNLSGATAVTGRIDYVTSA